MNEINIAYVLFRFPYLTETFIANEIWALRQQAGVKVHLFSLLKPKAGSVHPLSEQLLPDVWYAPSIYSWQLWWSQIYFLLNSPGDYLALLYRLLRQPYPGRARDLFLKRLAIFLKAVAVAYRLKGTPIQGIHTHFAWLSGAAARVISTLLNRPFTVTIHAYDIFSSENDLLCFTTSAATRVIAISEFNKQTVLQMCPGVAEKIVDVVHCGIDLELFHPLPRTNHKPLSILAVGSLFPKKGHKYLIQACQQLKVKGIKFRCDIIGAGSDEAALKQLISECKLEDEVVLLGGRRQPEVLQAYREHDIFVLACVVVSDGGRDGIPVVLMEAMAMQMPVISTPVSGIPELVRHGETGWLVPERDPVALAEAILKLAEDQPFRECLGRKGQMLVEEEFNIHRNAAQLAQIFRQIHKEQENLQY